VKDKVLRFAGEVHSPDDLLQNPKLKTYLDLGFDKEKLDFSDDHAKAYVEEMKKEKPYLWKAQGPLPAFTGKPGAPATSGDATVDFDKMKKDEVIDWIKKNYK
jgi:hypothetical protein